MNDWTVRFRRAIEVDSWADSKPIEVVAALHDWVARCREQGPPIDAWLVEIEEGYRYRYWLVEPNITIEFVAVVHERWMLITRID